MRCISITCALGLSVLLANPCLASKDLPRSLGEMHLGAAPAERLLVPRGDSTGPVRSVRQVRELKPDSARVMWASLMPGARATDISGSVTLYRGNVVSVDLASPGLTFELAQAAAVRRFGNGFPGQNLISDVPDGCAPYMFEQWVAGKLGLFLVGDTKSPGVSLHLRDNDLNHQMSMDDAVHIEYEQCIEF